MPKGLLLITLFCVCVGNVFGEFEDVSFISKSTSISDVRIEHIHSNGDGMWRNIQFNSASALLLKKTHQENLANLHIPWGGTPPSFTNFYLIAEIISTGEFIQCDFNTDSLWFDSVYFTNGNTHTEIISSPTFFYQQVINLADNNACVLS
jgi:hypothetical protein